MKNNFLKECCYALVKRGYVGSNSKKVIHDNLTNNDIRQGVPVLILF